MKLKNLLLIQKNLRWRKVSKHVDGSVLDLGCGSGEFSEYVDGYYVGVDQDKKAIVKAKQKFPNRSFLVKNIDKEKIEFKKKFDNVVMLAFIEHLNSFDSVKKIVDKNLSSNGRVIITTPSTKSKPILWLEAKLGLRGEKEHKMYFNRESLEKLASFLGLKIDYYEQFSFGFNQLVVLKRG